MKDETSNLDIAVIGTHSLISRPRHVQVSEEISVSNNCLSAELIHNTRETLQLCIYGYSRFHTYNGTRPSETVPVGSTLADDALYARPPDPRNPRVLYYVLSAQNIHII